MHPPSPGQRGCRGLLFFMIKQKIIRDKVRYCNLYRKLHGSRSINEKSHACLAKYL